MATPIVKRGETDEDFRKEIARTALSHISFLTSALKRERSAVGNEPDFEVIWTTLTDRLVELQDAAFNALDDDQMSTEELADIVFGEWTRAEELPAGEKAHG